MLPLSSAGPVLYNRYHPWRLHLPRLGRHIRRQLLCHRVGDSPSLEARVHLGPGWWPDVAPGGQDRSRTDHGIHWSDPKFLPRSIPTPPHWL